MRDRSSQWSLPKSIKSIVKHNEIMARGRLDKFKSFIQKNFSEQLFVELVDALTVIHNLEASHHITRNVGLLFVSDLLFGRIVLPFYLPVLSLDLS